MMKNQILTMLNKRGDWVSFAELCGIAGFVGDLGLVFPGYKNLIIWPGLSKDAFEALKELLAEKVIALESTSLLVYMADGRVPNIPLAKSKRNYKKPRWLPMCIRPGEMFEGRN